MNALQDPANDLIYKKPPGVQTNPPPENFIPHNPEVISGLVGLDEPVAGSSLSNTVTINSGQISKYRAKPSASKDTILYAKKTSTPYPSFFPSISYENYVTEGMYNLTVTPPTHEDYMLATENSSLNTSLGFSTLTVNTHPHTLLDKKAVIISDANRINIINHNPFTLFSTYITQDDEVCAISDDDEYEVCTSLKEGNINITVSEPGGPETVLFHQD